MRCPWGHKEMTPLSNWTATAKLQSLRVWLFMGRGSKSALNPESLQYSKTEKT